MAPSRVHLFPIALLALASLSHAAAVRPAKDSLLATRADVNLTLLSNATAIVQNLDYTSNCSLSISWYEKLPSNGAGSGNDPINIDFLRSALPIEYQDESEDQITSFYNDLSSGTLSNLGWLGTAKDDIETVCITPQFERKFTLLSLNPIQNCTATAIFLSSLNWIAGAQNYTAGSSNDTSWLEFLRAALPANDRKNLTDLELLVYRNYFLASENAPDITTFLQSAFEACKNDICKVQGYTGNPDIGGIGVIISYTVETILVTLYFMAINFKLRMGRTEDEEDAEDKEDTGNKDKKRYRIDQRKIDKALDKASDGLSDSALFFSFSISTAGWVSFVSGTSYYEKLVFTSANVLALSALFAFLGMFTAESRKKRGAWILGFMIAAILTESAIQYIVYMSEPNDKYNDFLCLHPQFQDEGYHPAIFEALFFLLLGLSVIAAIVGSIWLYYKHKKNKQSEQGPTGAALKQPVDAIEKKINDGTEKKKESSKKSKIEHWVLGTRIFIQTVAIIVMWVELVYLWKIRKIMSRIAGVTWSEGTWGFGQILALFVWLPPIIDILGWLVLPEWVLVGSNEKKKTKCGCGCQFECVSKKLGHECDCVLKRPKERKSGVEAPLNLVPLDAKDGKPVVKEVAPVTQ